MARADRLRQHGFLLLDKPSGITSHDAVSAVRRVFGQREVGHAGTLDPMATGLLVLGLGDATRLLRFVEGAQKRYLATVRLGTATTTFDAEGEVTESRAVDPPSLAEVQAALDGLTGSIQQRVPAYSAIKVGGERLYAKARRGEEVLAPIRSIEVHALKLLERRDLDLDLDLVVSKGTYVRSLAVDLGLALGAPAHLARLRRTEIGRFGVSEGLRLDALQGLPEELLPAPAAVEHLPAIVATEAEALGIRVGRALSARRVLEALPGLQPEDPFRIVSASGELLAMATPRADGATLAAGPPEDPGLRFFCVLVRPPDAQGGS